MTFSTGTLSALNGVLADLSMPNPLGATELVDLQAAGFRARARDIAGTGSVVERAVRVHDHVRDRIEFAFGPHSWRLPASRVLSAGSGHALPKATLFAALLRAVAIPARLRFLSVKAGLMDGLLALSTPRFDHAVVEVWLDGRWVPCDSYAIDEAYFRRASARLRASRQAWGLGVHIDGRVEWSGRGPSFSQLVTGGPDALGGVVDLGVHADASALYAAKVPESTRLSLADRLVWGRRASRANRRIREIRSTG